MELVISNVVVGDLLEWIRLDLICFANMEERSSSDRDGELGEDQPHHAAVCKKVGIFFYGNRGRDVGI